MADFKKNKKMYIYIIHIYKMQFNVVNVQIQCMAKWL